MGTPLATLLLCALAPAAAPDSADAVASELVGRAVERSIRSAGLRVRERIVLWSDHSSWDDPWVVESEHFRVQTTDRYHFGRKVALGLETMLGHFQRILAADGVPSQPLLVRIFPNVALYNAFGEDHGGVHSSILGSFWASGQPGAPVAVLRDQNDVLVQMWATHSAVHAFIGSAWPSRQPPVWLVEGLASYFTFYWDQDWAVAEFRRAVDQGDYIPIGQVFSESIDAYTGDPHTRFVELGVLFNYLLHYNEDTRMSYDGEDRAEPAASFRSFLRHVLGGGATESHPFGQAFGSEVGGEAEEAFRSLDWL